MDASADLPLPQLDLSDVQAWRVYWTEIARRIAPVFARSETRTRAMAYLAGLLSPAERKNSWQLAEITGDAHPYGFQHLLGRADWNPDALRDRLRAYVTEYLHAPDAVGVIDETGFLKKGLYSAGVARQYSGMAGRIENSQIGVFLTYASRHGHTLLDRELYLPAEWTTDGDRCRQAGIPEARSFATKPALAQQMVQRTFDAGVVLAWVTADCIYGNDRLLRQWLEGNRQAYVLALSGQQTVWTRQHQPPIKQMLAELPAEGWLRISAGSGSKGPRWYDWQRIELNRPRQAGWQRWLLVRRTTSEPHEMTAFVAFGPAATSLNELVRVAGMRWTIEESIQTAKGEVGLDHYEVRSCTGWYRHMTLAMWAQAFLAVVRAELGGDVALKKRGQTQTEVSNLASFKVHRGLRSD